MDIVDIVKKQREYYFLGYTKDIKERKSNLIAIKNWTTILMTECQYQLKKAKA